VIALASDIACRLLYAGCVLTLALAAVLAVARVWGV